MKYILTLFLVFSFLVNKASYTRLSLGRIIEISEYAVVGEIIDLNESHFKLRIDSNLFGSFQFDTVSIIRFSDWPCAVRSTPYKIGQKEIVFFGKTNYVSKTFDYILYGAGGESEILIFNDTVYHQPGHQWSDPKEKYFSKHFYKTLLEFRTEMEILIPLCIKKRKEEFEAWEKGLDSKIDYPILNSFQNRSELHHRIIDQYRGGRENWKVKNYGNSSTSLVFNQTLVAYMGMENIVEIVDRDYTFSEIYLEMDEAEIIKKEKYFVIIPNESSHPFSRMRSFGIRNQDTSRLSIEKILIMPIPDPVLSFQEYFTNDTISSKSNLAWPLRAKHYTHKAPLSRYDRESQILKYQVLSFQAKYFVGDNVKLFISKGNASNRKAYYFIEKLKNEHQLQQLSKIQFDNVEVLYPDGSIHIFNNQVFYYKIED